MTRSFALVCWLSAVGFVIAVPLTPYHGVFASGWEKPSDPSGDCKFVRDRVSLTIEVLGTDHDQCPARDRTNAPRLLRPVEGDFVVQVRVGGVAAPTSKSSVGDLRSFVAAGLVLETEGLTILFVYGAEQRDGSVQRYVSWRVQNPQGGERCICSEKWTDWPLKGREKAAFLRLERRGNQLLFSLSADGEKWAKLDPLGRVLPARMKVGILACSTSKEAFKPRFDEFQFTGADPKRK